MPYLRGAGAHRGRRAGIQVRFKPDVSGAFKGVARDCDLHSMDNETEILHHRKEKATMNAIYRATMTAALCWALASTASAQPAADRIWSGGPILTMNDAAMRAEAVAEKDGKIVAVGSRATVTKLKGPDTKLIDLGGRTMLPGFVDAHGHMFVGDVQALSANLLAPPDGDVKDIASLQKVVREWMAANDAAVKKVGLILGFGYDNASLAEHRHPNRDDLDQIS
ncbi:MAG: amidohydrolase family protein, partial [Desulfobacterales bacterium]|nr:amidohydrolase family protein [Desulfobacterales bacterium]